MQDHALGNPVGADTAWRDLAGLAADMLFETDAEGRFTVLEPDRLFGWNADELIGQRADILLPDAAAPFDPFRPGAPFRRRRVQVRTATGGVANLLMSAVPLLDAQGRRQGARGVGQDISRQDARDAAAIADRRRNEALSRIMDSMRRETLPGRRMQAVLDGLIQAMGADGAAVTELFGRAVPMAIRHRAGAGHDVLTQSPPMLDSADPEPAQTVHGNRPLMACALVTRFGERIVLAAWRAEGAAAWTDADLQLPTLLAPVVGGILEHDSIQREMARQIRNDPLTGLLNRRAFTDEALRRIDRLDREEQSGTLLLVDLDDFGAGGAISPEAGDEALCSIARILRPMLRPADLVARLGGGSFAAWMDGADELTGAERAEMLRLQVPNELAHFAVRPGTPVTVSIGIACRRPGKGEELESLMRRAGLALEEAKHGGWRVSHDEPN